ncbi:hypothetical protein V8E53_007603 [Lactarius tabidus]
MKRKASHRSLTAESLVQHDGNTVLCFVFLSDPCHPCIALVRPHTRAASPTSTCLILCKSSTASTATRVDISCLPPPDAELPPITDVIQDFKATAGRKPTASHNLLTTANPTRLLFWLKHRFLQSTQKALLDRIPFHRMTIIMSSTRHGYSAEHPLCVNSMPPSVWTTTSPEIPTSLAQEMAQVITCAMPQLLGPDTGLMPQAHPFIRVWRTYGTSPSSGCAPNPARGKCSGNRAQEVPRNRNPFLGI